MLKRLSESPRFRLAFALAAMSAFCFLLSVSRFFITESKLFIFLNWNLFLAAIPWLATSLLMRRPAYTRNGLVVALVLLFWLLFFPNAPYILTDLFHLKLRHSSPIWFDLALVLAFAWTGLAFGFASLLDVERLLLARMKKRYVSLLVVVLLFISSFGIYLGRYLRWNSWDIISEPEALLYDIGVRLLNPGEYPGAWGMTLLMGVLLNMMYWTIHLLATYRPVLAEGERKR